MGIDVRIGKVKLITYDDIHRDNVIGDYEEGGCFVFALDVEPCPDEDFAISNYTIYPKASYRCFTIGSEEDFFCKYLPNIYDKLRLYSANDKDVAKLKPVIEEINDLNIPEDELNVDRMKWFKYWCRRAVDLYGDEAAIMFS